jgi:Raf kinase inhibitor-like YbhB/YbcL family protein
MQITSQAFKNQEKIPAKYTCDGENVNPPLQFSDIPAEAKSLALIVDDPDAPRGDWVHWLVWNMKIGRSESRKPGDTEARNLGSSELEKIEIAENSVPERATQGLNDFGKNNWGGPCPPSGSHRYFFKVYALDTILDLPVSSKKADLLAAMNNHILAQGELVGVYSRK